MLERDEIKDRILISHKSYGGAGLELFREYEKTVSIQVLTRRLDIFLRRV